MGWSTTYQDDSMYIPISGYEPVDLPVNSDNSTTWMQNDKDIIFGKLINDFGRIHLAKIINNDSLNASDECIDNIKSIVNNFESNAGLIAKIVLRSGKDVNDLGKYNDCKNDKLILFSFN